MFCQTAVIEQNGVSLHGLIIYRQVNLPPRILLSACSDALLFIYFLIRLWLVFSQACTSQIAIYVSKKAKFTPLAVQTEIGIKFNDGCSVADVE